MDTRDFSRVSSIGVIHMFETINYWFLQDTNDIALNSFVGVGYAKKVMRALINKEEPAINDSLSNFVYNPNNTAHAIHLETGFTIGFTDRSDVTKIIKILNIPRGETELCSGTFF